jgi:tripeptide aminopeptidase
MKKGIIEEFTGLVEIDNESLKERKMADHIKKRLSDMGYEPFEDDAGEKAGGDAGNIICKIKGDSGLPSIMFLAHMDSVYPCIGKKAVIEDGIIRSAGDTVLGSDDLSGVAAMLNLAGNLIGNESPRGDVWLIFTIAEEIGLVGARHLDTGKIKADFAYVLDSGGDIGRGTVSAPSHNTFKTVIKGRAAHAGMEPEKGISAIIAASKAIASMPLGRIDEETTSNIGKIEGGRALNIVCDEVTIQGEIRSRDINKLDKITASIEKAFKDKAGEMGAIVEMDIVKEYNSFSVPDDEPMLIRYKKALENLGLEFVEEHSGGGSDTNIIYNKGIKALTISSGIENAHMKNEYIKIGSLEKLEKLMFELVKA